MSVTQTLMAAGAWSLRLRPDVPQQILDQIDFFDHLVITEAPEDIRLAGDNVLSTALYTGVVRGITRDDTTSRINKAGQNVWDASGPELSGAGMAVWLGDEDDKGAVLEAARTYTAQTFTSVIADLLTGASIHAGTVHAVSGTYTGTHQYQSPRKAISYVCSTMGAEWRVNNDGTLDAGLVSDLYPTTPRAGIFASSRGTSMTLKALDGQAQLASDVDDFTTRVVLLAEGVEASVATGSADIAGGLNPYKDLFGNTIKFTRLISESSTTTGNANARAALQLGRFTSTRDAVTLSSTTHDVSGSLAVGEYAWVYDPDAGLYDLNNEVQWQGERLNAVLLRVTTLTWPVEDGRGVYVRTRAGAWLDLTDYVNFETGQTNVTVGGYDRSLVATGTESVWQRMPTLTADSSVPSTPAFTVPFTQATYLSTLSGQTKTQIRLAWAQPTNTDGTPIIDGDHYEIRFRSTTQPIAPVTHAQMAVFTHTTLGAQPNQEPIPYTTGTWDTRITGFDNLTYTLIELTPGVTYELQIRALDNATPPNASPWSASQLVASIADNLPPSTPAPATVAGSRVAVEVRHDLGKAEGGTFNLEQDLNHLEVHAEYEPNYEPRPSAPSAGGTMIGKLRAGPAEINGAIPVVGTFQTDMTNPVYVKVVAVDNAGNRSRPSAAAPVTALLIDSAHISDLTASKITAGTITSQIVQGGTFATSFTPGVPHVGFDGLGFFGQDAAGALYFSVDQTGSYVRGHIVAGSDTGTRIELDPGGQELYFYPTSGSTHYTLQSFFGADPSDPANTPGLWMFGVNTSGQIEGAGVVLYEDGYRLDMPNAGGATKTGGYVQSNRLTMTTGFEDGLNPTHGYDFIAGSGNFWIQSKNTGTAGGFLQGDLNNLWLSVHNTSAADRQLIHLDSNSNSIFFLSGTSGGYLIHTDGGANASPSIHGHTPTAQQAMFFVYQDLSFPLAWHAKVWDDSAWVPLHASAFTVHSDENTKTGVAPYTDPVLAKVKGTPVRSYRRKGANPPPIPDSEWTVDADGTRHMKPGAADRSKQRADDPAFDGPQEIGLLAQEAPPEIVIGGAAVDLYQMATMTWKAAQELAAQNDALTARVAALEDAVAKLTKKGP